MAFIESGRNRRRVGQIVWITLIWTLVGMLDAFNTHTLAESVYLDQTPVYQFKDYLWVSTLSAFVSGLVCSVVLLFFLRDRFRSQSFGLALLINSMVISALCFVFSTIVYDLFLSLQYRESILAPQVLEQTGHWLSGLYLKNLILWTVVAFITIIFINVNDKYGPGILAKLLLGRYHRPREEARIFMFADIRGSTIMAEKLGHIRFFNLLNDFFRLITNPIIETSGEIYQYVGDEIVISWTMERGLHHGNCIRCFYRMQEALRKRAPRLKEKYGLVPEFKVGLHAGMVTVGEIGVIKKDIVFSGDVLNTTSRIQNLCNAYNVNILLSKTLLDYLQLPPHDYRPHRVGLIQLRGKKRRIELYTFLKETEDLPVRPPIAST